MGRIHLALVWHHHQPYYKDLASGEMLLPWVRLHGIKDYYGMARILGEFPEMRATINLVPSLVMQIEDYVEGRSTDAFQRSTEPPADGLSAQDAEFLLDHFFMAQWDRMIRPHARYAELLAKRGFGRRRAAEAARTFQVEDLRDLQVWFNLVWFHPLAVAEDEGLRDLIRKGRGFSEDDKRYVLARQRAILAKVIPLHRDLAARGQIELTTTPCYHPILPLLCDMRSAHAGLPGTPLPAGHFPNAEDARAQVSKAVELHRRVFGAAPQGMWPAEGSVSPEIVPLAREAGIRWIATDQQILERSSVSFNGSESLGGDLYRAYTVGKEGEDVAIVFRDHGLSDLIGFTYQGWDSRDAAANMIARLNAAASQTHGDDALVTLILDGENCWEHYPDQGVPFLRELYGRLARSPEIEPKTVSGFLSDHPPRARVAKLFSGSWINHDFYIWIGHEEDRKAWEYVFRTREDLVRAAARRRPAAPGDPAAPDRALAAAWEEIYIAEGSDWYWWYGDDHSSGNDEAFDRLFRTHLKNVYRFLGQEPPFFLDSPVLSLGRAGRFTLPGGTLEIALDGRATSYFEWIGAGEYRADKEGSVMTEGRKPLVESIYFGFDKEGLCLRVDFNEERLDGAAAHPAVRLAVIEPKEMWFAVRRAGGGVEVSLSDGSAAAQAPCVCAGWDEVLEMKVPRERLGVQPGQTLSFYVDAAMEGEPWARLPRACPVSVVAPAEDFDKTQWLV